MPTRQGIPALVTAARRLDDADIALADLGLRRPSLDDVFFAITGDARPRASRSTCRAAATAAGAAQRPSGQRCSVDRRRPLSDIAL